MAGYAADTSCVVAAQLEPHDHHAVALDAVVEHRPAVPAHVLVESFSVLSRLPGGFAPRLVAEALESTYRDVLALPGAAYRRVIRTLASANIGGGRVYDGIVAATARHHDRTLLSLDRRAVAVYELVGCSYELLL